MRVTGQVWVVKLVKPYIHVWWSSVNPKILFVLGTGKKTGFEGSRMFIVCQYLAWPTDHAHGQLIGWLKDMRKEGSTSVKSEAKL